MGEGGEGGWIFGYRRCGTPRSALPGATHGTEISIRRDWKTKQSTTKKMNTKRPLLGKLGTITKVTHKNITNTQNVMQEKDVRPALQPSRL